MRRKENKINQTQKESFQSNVHCTFGKLPATRSRCGMYLYPVASIPIPRCVSFNMPVVHSDAAIKSMSFCETGEVKIHSQNHTEFESYLDSSSNY